ncbi:MAG: alpha/beta hydrolase [Anaerolineae bacterium CG_4_9_14_0_8_um_filter_58_9]|nr:MAG: alpha/beta hydrolase [Anaerolineae bacterium CG_4_9_14_0_8_um_filter_58_9]
MNIPYFTLGESGPPLHFAHANGYPPECYRPLLTGLSAHYGSSLRYHYHVLAMYQRPLWPDAQPGSINDWHPLSDDLFRFLDERNTGPVIGVGHSLGGIVTLRAALRQPERFQALILIDPVLFPPTMITAMRLMRALGLSYRLHPLVRGALNRRRVFSDREVIFKGYRRKPIFRYLDDAGLKAYVEGLTRPRPDGQYELVYGPEWEARIYVTGVWRDVGLWRGLPKLQVPLLILRGAETDTFWESTARRVKRKLPSAQIITLPQATHLVPLERPLEVSALIHEFLSTLPHPRP